MTLKEKLQAWFKIDEDRLSEDAANETLFASFPGESREQLAQAKEEIFLDQVVENLISMPNLKFHAQMDFYPFPNSEELQKAKLRLDPLGKLKKKH